MTAAGWLTLREAATYAGVSPDTIRRAVKRRHLLCGRTGRLGDLRFQSQHIDQWLLRHGGSLPQVCKVA